MHRFGSTLAARLGLCIAGLVLILHALRYDFFSDDAFIVARYARNVIQGHGWVYNVGERVEGYTSFAWLAMTAALCRVGIDPVFALRGLSLVSAIACQWQAYVAARSLAPAPPLMACVAPLLLAASAPFACWSLGGLEACGFAAVILAAVCLAGDDRASPKKLALSGLAAGACALVRPDGLAVAATLMGWVAWRRRSIRQILPFLLPAAELVFVHLAWRRGYYGEWLPNTYYVKVGFTSDQVLWGLSYVQTFFRDQGGIVLWLTPFAAVWLVRVPPLARLASLMGLVIIAGVIAVGGDGLPMYRFLVPLLPLWALLVYTLLAKLLWRMRDGVVRCVVPQPIGYAAAILVVGLLGLAEFAIPADSTQYRLYSYQKRIEVPWWSAAGKWLAAHAAPGSSIAGVPIGAVGYQSGLHVYDMMGLVDRHIAHRAIELGRGWSGHEKHDGPYILSKKPTYLLLGNIDVSDSPVALDDPEFVRPANVAIRAREDDIFTPELYRQYEPVRVELDGGLYFHFLRLKRAIGTAG